MSTEVIIPEIGYRSDVVARMFGVTKRTVTNWVKQGVLPGRIVGGTVLVYRGPVDRMRAEAEAA